MTNISSSTPTTQPYIKFIQQFNYQSSDSECSLPISKIQPILASTLPQDYTLIHDSQLILKTQHIDFIDSQYDFKQLTRKIKYVIGNSTMAQLISENQLRAKSYRIHEEIEFGYSWNSSNRTNHRLICIKCKRRCRTQSECQKYRLLLRQQRRYRNAQCFACYKKGHIAKICPYAKRFIMSNEKTGLKFDSEEEFIEY